MNGLLRIQTAQNGSMEEMYVYRFGSYASNVIFLNERWDLAGTAHTRTLHRRWVHALASRGTHRTSHLTSSPSCASESVFLCDGSSQNCELMLLFRYWEVQVDISETVQGWVYWAWKVSLIRLCPASVQVSVFLRGASKAFVVRAISAYLSGR